MSSVFSTFEYDFVSKFWFKFVVHKSEGGDVRNQITKAKAFHYFKWENIELIIRYIM